ncbi:MAG: hypothetical protein GF329_12170 [Candidatus Lokiarchaeota archaeon]|nr:hypothetical protein [Candidatus Lokiarchaeota archaeon]
MMICKNFPIEGNLKNILLILEWAIVLFCFELAIVFWLRVKQKDISKLKRLQEKAYVWLFLGFSIMWTFIIIGDHYVYDSILRERILNTGFLIQVICALIFIYILEKYRIFIRRFLFTKLFICLLVPYVIVIIFFIEYGSIFSSFFWFIFVLFFITYIKQLYFDLYLKKKSYYRLKNTFLKLLPGVIIVFIGYFLTTRIVVNMFGLIPRLLGDIVQLSGIVFLYSFFVSVPSFSEFEWQENLESIFLIHKSGLFIYKKLYKQESNGTDDSILSGTMALIKMMLEEITKTEELSIIEKNEKIIIIYPGQFLYGIVVADKDLESLQILLQSFIDAIENIYRSVFLKWDGSLEIFNNIDRIRQEFFF